MKDIADISATMTELGKRARAAAAQLAFASAEDEY